VAPQRFSAQKEAPGRGLNPPAGGSFFRSPPHGWDRYPNLQLRPHAPNAGRGRLQRQIARCFHINGPEVSAAVIYDWCALWPVDKRSSQAQRWSIVRVLETIAVRVRKVPPHGAWLWRLRNAAAILLDQAAWRLVFGGGPRRAKSGSKRTRNNVGLDAMAAYETACKQWPGEVITLRQGARIIKATPV
jgi:hypothetical protein